MSSSRISRRLALLAVPALAGCGFAPVYGNDRQITGLISFVVPENEIGFHLRQRLEERLGTPEAAAYTLRSSITTSERAAAITAEGDRSRLNIIGTARWSLIDDASGREVETGTVDAFTSYSATGSTVATQATRDDARERLAVILADMIVARVLLKSDGLSA